MRQNAALCGNGLSGNRWVSITETDYRTAKSAKHGQTACMNRLTLPNIHRQITPWSRSVG